MFEKDGWAIGVGTVEAELLRLRSNTAGLVKRKYIHIHGCGGEGRGWNGVWRRQISKEQCAVHANWRKLARASAQVSHVCLASYRQREKERGIEREILQKTLSRWQAIQSPRWLCQARATAAMHQRAEGIENDIHIHRSIHEENI